MLISLHIPKSAGTSFKILLESYYKNSFLEDYDDLPLNKPFEQALEEAERFSENLNSFKRLKYFIKGIKCIHGHFLIRKYIKFVNYDNVIFITWVREPLERMQSHYDYWYRTYNPKTTKAFLHKKVVEEKWSFETFCFSEEMKNIYSKFFHDFSLDDFDFIGVTEFFNEDATYFMKKLQPNKSIDIPFNNVSPDKKTKKMYDENFVLKFKDFHSADYVIYDYALKQRQLRLSQNDIT